MKKNLLFLSLGSNRGDRSVFLGAALEWISEKIGTVVRRSPVYETAPWGFKDKSPFLNQVAEVRTALEPELVLVMILEIERSMGRDRIADLPSDRSEKKYLSRTIDIDILFYNDLVLDIPGLVIPHPLIAMRRFVLVPYE